MKISRKTISIIVIVILAAGAFLAFRLATSKKTPTPASAGNKTYVEVQQAKTVKNTSVLSFKATLEPVEEGIVSSEISGKVVEILFNNGKKVTRGEPMVMLDDQYLANQLKSAQTNLQKLELNLDLSQRNYDRIKQLYDNSAVSKSDFENAEAALKTASVDLESAKVNIEILKDTLEDVVVRSPISGAVDEKDVILGQFVSPGDVLTKVKNTASLYAVIQLKQSDLNKVKAGLKAAVKLSREDTQGYQGVVKAIDVSADVSARVFDCKVQIENESEKLHPGEFVYVEIPVDETIEKVVIPMKALTGAEGNYSIFTIENGIARKHTVTIGEIQNNLAEVISGLKAGEKVIITNLNMLQDGDAVAVSGQGE